MNTLCYLRKIKEKYFSSNNNINIFLQYVVNELPEIQVFVQSHIQQVNFEHEYNLFYFQLITFLVVILVMVQMEYLLMMFENFLDLDFDEIPRNIFHE